MRRSFWLLFVLAGLAGATSVSAPDGDELERNRRLLEKWKADPDHYQRLQRDLAAFHALPAERQERIRLFDQKLHEADPTTQARLWGVLERYALWLERLPEEERRTVLEAPAGQSRLAVIRALKQREWLDRLPRGLRVKLMALPSEARATRMMELRLEERRQRILWERPLGVRQEPIPRPKQMKALPREVQEFVQNVLRPRLSDSEKHELAAVEGKWPELPRLVAKLATAHPVLPPLPKGPITRVHELPASMRHPLLQRSKSKVPFHLQGKWPEFALAVTDLYRSERGGQRPPPLGASKPDELPPEVSAFLRDKLMPALSHMEAEALRRLEGRWPEYPYRLLRLGHQKRLVIPGMSLPGPPEMWESADLALHELSPEDRESLDTVAGDRVNMLERIRKMATQQKKGRWPERGKSRRRGR
jgi:hypothetical protein